MKNPITPEGAASAQNPLPPVPTTKILAISHFMGTPMTPTQRAQIMPHEVHDTVNAYLAGKIDQWYFLTDGKGVVFIVNARDRKSTRLNSSHIQKSRMPSSA